MESLMTLPCIFSLPEGALMLEIRENDQLVRKYYRASTDDTDENILLSDCNGFSAAADSEKRLHLLAANSERRLVYCVLSGLEAANLPFSTAWAPESYVLAFNNSNIGYFCGGGNGKIIIGICRDLRKWEFIEREAAGNTIPVQIVVDQASYAHLLLYDAQNYTLAYQTVEPRQCRCSTPLILSDRAKLQAVPALLFDSVQNIHIAWISDLDKHLHYRVRLAGGWPLGGWQQENSIPLHYTAKLMSFDESYPHPEIWILDYENTLHYYHHHDTEEHRQAPLSGSMIPLRSARLNTTEVRLHVSALNQTLLQSISTEKAEEQTVSQNVKEEEDNPFFLHARKLMSEKKRLELELSKREASLAQLRHMLEMSQENVKRQTILLNDKLNDIHIKVKELQQKNSYLETKCHELQSYADRYSQSQKSLETAEAANNQLKQQLTGIRNELAGSLIREKDYVEQIKMLSDELAAKKGVWETITTVFHKKPSPKK